MELKLIVVGNQAQSVNKAERSNDNKQAKEKVSRITAQGDKAVLQFTVDYEAGKAYELDKELAVTVSFT